MQQLIDDEMKPVSECDTHVRRRFLTRVYTLLSLQLLLTIGGATLCVAVPSVRFVVAQPSPIPFVLLVVSLLLLCALHHYAEAHPWNLLLLLSFTLCESYMVGSALVHTEFAPQTLVGAGANTACIFAGALWYVRTQSVNLDTLQALLGSGFATLACSLVLTLVLGLPNEVLLAPVGIGLFSLYLIHDLSVVMDRLGPDDAIIACLTLYLDLLNLFLCTLQCLQGSGE